MRSVSEREKFERRQGRLQYHKQMQLYQEAVVTIHDVTEMSSDDIVENADFAFECPELTLFGADEKKERAMAVGQTLRQLGRLFARLQHVPLSPGEMDWLARAAEVFSRRFEVLAELSAVTPQDSPAAARATLETILPEVVDSRLVLMLSAALGGTESLHSQGKLANPQRFFGPFVQAIHWTAFAESFPEIFIEDALLQKKIVLNEKGRRRFLDAEMARWLNEKHEQWFQPERLLSAAQLFLISLDMLAQHGVKGVKEEVRDFLRAMQNVLLEKMRVGYFPKLSQRRRVEKVFFEIEQLIPQTDQSR